MIKGILFFENGEVQIIGDLTNARAIISAMKQVIPQLEQQEKEAALKLLSNEDLTSEFRARTETSERDQ